MNIEKFTNIYNESRNGANRFYSHWFVRKFQYSDGVQDLADCGLFWFLDIVATEVAQLAPLGDLGEVHIKVTDGIANLWLSLDDDAPHAWQRPGVSTDCPEGNWMFFLVNEGSRYAFILPSEY